MAGHGEGSNGGEQAIVWSRARRSLVLVFVLLLVAVGLVVCTQNFDEQATIHFLLWSFDMPLLFFFLGSISLGVLVDELFRFAGRRRRAAPPL